VFVNIEASETTAQDLGGEAVVRPPRAVGETYFIGYTKTPKAHRVDNSGRTPFRVVDAEIHAGCGSSPRDAPPPNAAVVVENERVRVTRIRVQPGQTATLAPTCGLLIAVRSGTLEFRGPGATETVSIDRAGFKWRDGFAPLTVANVGSAAFQGIDIVVK
jgi:hypothetical protein